MKLRIWLLLSLLASTISWLYVSRILDPWERYIEVARGQRIAQMGDLYPRWVGTRELLLHGRNPYGPEVTQEIQMAFYGHAIHQEYGKPGVDLIDEQRFVYPVYVVFLLAPTVHADFSRLQIWAPFVLAGLTAISVLLWLDVLRWHPPKLLSVAIILFVLSAPQIVQGLRIRQLALFVGFLLALSTWCVIRNQLALAGVILAVSTVKPQLVALPLAWFLFWSVSGWPKRWPLLAGFSSALAVLVGMGELILPGWPRYFVEGLIAYRKYFPTTSLLRVTLGDLIGGVVSAIAIVALFAFAWANRKADIGSAEFNRTLAAFFICASLAMPLLTPFNQILLLMPALMLFCDWKALPRAGRGLFAAVIAWPWLCSSVLLCLPIRVDSPNRLPLLPSVTVLLVPFLVVVLFATNRKSNHPALLAAESALP